MLSSEAVQRVHHAIDEGLSFLDSFVDKGGLWSSYGARTAEPDRGRHEGCVFIAAAGILILQEMDSPRARNIVARTRHHLCERMFHPGVWNFWPISPLDADDTALASLAVGMHPLLFSGHNIRWLLKYRDERGLFLTWLSDQVTGNDVCPVVNANVVAYLGDTAETRPAQEWLTALVESGDAARLMQYYQHEVELYAAVVRAGEYGKPAFAGLCNQLGPVFERLRMADGTYGDSLRTAMALDALATLDALPTGDEVERTIRFILSAQQADGGWPESPAFWGPPPPQPANIVWSSRGYDTVICIGALHRVLTRLRIPALPQDK